MDHVKRRTVKLDKVETVVLDEADRMLDMGFIEEVTRILDMMPQRKNLGLFSATISREVMDISWVYQRDPVEITVRPVEDVYKRQHHGQVLYLGRIGRGGGAVHAVPVDQEGHGEPADAGNRHLAVSYTHLRGTTINALRSREKNTACLALFSDLNTLCPANWKAIMTKPKK